MPAMDDEKRRFLEKVGAEMRYLRESVELVQQDVADIFGWGRDAMSKVENGRISISLYDYLTIMHFYRDVAPEHPALKLRAHIERFPQGPKAANDR